MSHLRDRQIPEPVEIVRKSPELTGSDRARFMLWINDLHEPSNRLSALARPLRSHAGRVADFCNSGECSRVTNEDETAIRYNQTLAA
jgi:hypothetical protein